MPGSPPKNLNRASLIFVQPAPKSSMDIDRTIGMLAALDYLGLDFGHTPVIGRTNHEFPKRKPRHWASLATAMKLRLIKPKTK